MNAVLGFQSMLAAALGVGLFVMMLWAFIDCLRTRPDAFTAAGKQTKQIWSLLTGIAALVGFIFMFNPFNLFNLAAIVAAAVYLTDVRPAVRSFTGKRGPGTHMGPYGPW